MRKTQAPRLVIAAPASGSGKTLLACGLLAALQLLRIINTVHIAIKSTNLDKLRQSLKCSNKLRVGKFCTRTVSNTLIPFITTDSVSKSTHDN